MPAPVITNINFRKAYPIDDAGLDDPWIVIFNASTSNGDAFYELTHTLGRTRHGACMQRGLSHNGTDGADAAGINMMLTKNNNNHKTTATTTVIMIAQTAAITTTTTTTTTAPPTTTATTTTTPISCDDGDDDNDDDYNCSMIISLTTPHA